MFLSQASDGLGDAYPLLSAGLTRPIFHLLDLCHQLSASIVSDPTFAGVEVCVQQSPFLAEQDMDGSHGPVNVGQGMDVSCFLSLGVTLPQDDAGQFHLPPLPRIALISSHMSIY